MKPAIEIRGPSNGYLTDAKMEYRNNIWNYINTAFNEDISDKKVLIFPSNNDKEIKIVLSYGIKEENIWACDDNPALLASAKWRKEYPKINILGVKLERAIEILQAKKVKIDIANFDFCSNLCAAVFKDVSNFINKVGSAYFCYGVNILKGRETSVETLLAKMLFTEINGSVDRVKILSHYVLKVCDVKIKKFYQSEYKSGNQYMSYGVYKTIQKESIKKKFLKIFDNNAELINRVYAVDIAFYNAQKLHASKLIKLWDNGPSKKKTALLKRRSIAQSKILNKFQKDRRILEKYISNQEDEIEGFCNDGYSGRNPFIKYTDNRILYIYHKIISMPTHRIS